jgi:hypothetical protein
VRKNLQVGAHVHIATAIWTRVCGSGWPESVRTTISVAPHSIGTASAWSQALRGDVWWVE